MGVPLESHKISQVSMNLQNYKITNLHHAFETIDSLCKNMNGQTKGSELVGLIPLDAMLQAGVWYGGEGLSEMEYIDLAIRKLGLNSIGPLSQERELLNGQWRVMKNELGG